MRISDWSSDVCSSDLDCPGQLDRRFLALRHGFVPPFLVCGQHRTAGQPPGHRHGRARVGRRREVKVADTDMQVSATDGQREYRLVTHAFYLLQLRKQTRRGGEECVNTCRSLWSP